MADEMNNWKKRMASEDEMMTHFKELAKPAFTKYIALMNPLWSKKKVAKLVAECEKAYEKDLEEAKITPPTSYDVDVFLNIFPPIVFIPLQELLVYWGLTYVPEKIYAEVDYEFSPSDIIDGETLFSYLTSLPIEMRNAGYKRIGLNSILISKVERAIISGSRELFEESLLPPSPESNYLCRYFGRMARSVPFYDVSAIASLNNEEKVQYMRFLSKDVYEELRELRRKTRHLPLVDQLAALADCYVSWTKKLIQCYVWWKPKMAPEVQAIIESVISVPLFPWFKQYFNELVEDKGQQIPERGFVNEYTIPEDVFDENKKVVDDRTFVGGLKTEVVTSENKIARFQKLFNYLLEWGKVENEAERNAMLTLLTGYNTKGAATRARWCCDEKMPRVLYYVVKHISNSRDKYKPLLSVDFYTTNAEKQQNINADLRSIRRGKNPSSTIEKAIGSEIKNALHGCYPDLFGNPKS